MQENNLTNSTGLSRNIPKLHFPEFSGGWEKKKLGEVAEKIQDGTHFSPKAFDEGDFLYLTSKNVKNGYIELSTAQFISTEAHRSIYKRCDVRKGDVLITKDGTIGQTCVNELEMEFSLLSSVAFIRPLKEFSNYFIYQLLASDIGQKEIESQIAGQALKRITLTKINNFNFLFPTLPEQQKIASFLTTVDDKLQALKKKKSLLEQYKKGVMQKIFSQELRFKADDGSEFHEWEETKLGEICEHLSSGKDKPNENDDYPIYGSMGIIGYSSKFSYERKVILIARVGANAGTINIVEGKFGVTDNTLVLINKIEFDIAFIYYLLIFQNLNKLVFGSGQPLITAGHLKSIDLIIPSHPEQTKIANFLLTIDEKIQLVQGQVEKLEVWKKGLLQKMFV